VSWYENVPKDVAANLEYRARLRDRVAANRGDRKTFMEMCRQDVLYFFNSFCWLHEPRRRFIDGVLQPHVIPFVSRPHQDKAILEMLPVLGEDDIGIEKARDEGASWIGVLLALHAWIFQPDVTVGMCSSSEEKADKPGDRGTMMGKLDFELTVLPEWMVGIADEDWKRNKNEHTLKNLVNGSLIVAHSATGRTGRSHRYLWFLLDELGEWNRGDDEAVLTSLHQATDSRLIVSTPQGSDGAYYRLMHEPSNMLKIVLDWKDNIAKNRGLYEFRHGKPVVLDPANPLPPEYDPPSTETKELFGRLRNRGFNLEGGARSPWYDKQCDRMRATPQSIAQELDRDYGGSSYRVFGDDFFEKARATVEPPQIRGVMSYHSESLEPEFDRTPDGEVLLWTELVGADRPPRGSYVIGADVSAGMSGSYSSNSALVVINATTMEQVAEFASPAIVPSDFADLSIAIAKWFYDAYLIWEQNGPGAGFAKRVINNGYPNVYRRTVQFKRGRKKTKELGWWTGVATKEAMFGEFMRSVRRGDLLLRSEAMVSECEQYVRAGIDEVITHQLARTTDERSRGQAHGDRVIAAAVCLQAVRDRPVIVEKVPDEKVSPWCVGGRLRAREEALTLMNDEWDDRPVGQAAMSIADY